MGMATRWNTKIMRNTTEYRDSETRRQQNKMPQRKTERDKGRKGKKMEQKEIDIKRREEENLPGLNGDIDAQGNGVIS